MRLLPLLLAAGWIGWSAESFVIRNVHVFDGDHVIEQTSVVVEGGLIQAVGPEAKAPKGAREIDGSGKTLLPGLIDSHTHIHLTDVLKQSAVFGVTTNLDMFSAPDFVAGIKKQKAGGRLADHADLFSAGFLATAPGGHGTEYGIKVPTLTKPEEAQSWVDARIAEGSDYIKIIYDDALEYGFPKPTPTLTKETMKALVEAAHRRGKVAVVHIGSLRQAEDAIEAGADGLAHLFVGPSEPEFGRLAVSHHIFVIPTLSVLNSICGTPFNSALAEDPRLKAYLPSNGIAALTGKFRPMKVTCEGASEAVKQLKAEHVAILVGTDAGNPGTTYGASLHGELELLVRAGLTPAEALHAATAAPAATFHLTDRGRITAGLKADLLLVTGNPVTEISATRQIVSVWLGGVEIDRAAWKRVVDQQVEEEAKQRSAPPPPGSESGWISDFEQEGEARARFGAGWATTDDQVAGGKSVAQMEVASGGANGSSKSLAVTGEIRAGSSMPWAGVQFFPGQIRRAPANLYPRKAIRFWAKGDGQTYRLMVFARKLGDPAVRNFVAGPGWKEFVFPFAELGGLDGSGITSFVWCGGPQLGAFQFRIDEVRVE